MKLVMKFGGTSLDSGEKIKGIVDIIRNHKEKHEIVVVLSAFSGITNGLTEIAQYARNGRTDEVGRFLKGLVAAHWKVTEKAIKNESIRKEIKDGLLDLTEELKRTLMGITLLRELTSRSKDYILSFGERMSSLIVWGAVRDADMDAELFTGASVGIVTDSNFGEAQVLLDSTKYQVKQRLRGTLRKGKIAIVTGFIAADQDGVITTLGRGGSDYTATLIGSGIGASEVWLWSDVDGLMTGNPRIIKDARALGKVSFEEAGEMALLGMKGLHPKALEPASADNIPVRIRNTFNPSHTGTLVANMKREKVEPVRAVALIEKVGQITVAGVSMVGMPGTAARVFDTLARKGINIMMISQSISESNISMIVSRGVLHKARAALELELLGNGIIREVNSEKNLSVVAAIGSGMRHTPGIAARVFGAVAKRGINVRMIAQDSSENNISFVVEEGDGHEAIRALHEEFRLGA